MISEIVFILMIGLSAVNCLTDIKSNSLSYQDKTNRVIVFWGPSTVETDSTMNEEELEVYSDYYHHLMQATPVLKNLGIVLKDTTSRILKIGYDDNKTEIFYREQNSISYIFTDGVRKPKVIREVMTDAELVSEAKKYFNLK